MDNTQKEEENSIFRKKRINRLKKAIIITIVICVLFPTLLCIILFGKVYSLEKKIEKLTLMQQGTGEQKTGAFEKNLYYQAEDYSSSLEESDKNSYNEEEISDASSQWDISTDKANAEAVKQEEADTGNPKAGKDETLPDSAMQSEEERKADSQPDDTGKESKVDIGKQDTKKKEEKPLKKEQAVLSAGDRKKYEGKEVYLTFDDGPSSNTDSILDILDEYHVKATFFVIGKTDEQSKKLYKRIVEEGHSIGMHSYSHDYNQIYQSLKAFESDFKRIRKLIFDTTGVMPDIYRFPGGSGNQVSATDMSEFIRYLGREKVVYYDWNAVSGDATGIDYTPEQLCDNALEGISSHTRAIVLMHDTDAKGNTVKSLPELLSVLTQSDAKLLTLDKTVKPIQQVKISSSELHK